MRPALANTLYVLLCAGLMLAAGLLATLGLYTLSMALFALPIALYTALPDRGKAAGLVLLALLTPVLFEAPAFEALRYGVACTGAFLLGFALERRWRFGWCLTVLCGTLFVVVTMSVALHWESNMATADAMLGGWVAHLEQVAARDDAGNAEVLVGYMRWYRENWPYTSLGVFFSFILQGSALAVALLYWWQRLFEMEIGPREPFSRMRVPEWVVWLAILAAVLWFIDRQWHNYLLRVLSWNGALALAAVYWLNGLAIFIHVLAAVPISRILFWMLVITMLILPNMSYPLLCGVGFFDTWIDFRGRMAKALAARGNGDGRGGD